MDVLILHQHFKTPESGGALRSYFLAQALIKRGHTVQLIAGSDHAHYVKEKVDGIEVHYLPVPYSNHFGFWRRIFSFIRFVVSFCRISAQFKKVSLCYAISVPLTIGWAARWMKWRYQVPFIFEVGDLWPDAPIELDVIQNSLLKRLLWRIERKMYREAMSIVALSPSISEAISRKAPGKRIVVVPNMADTEFFQPEAKKSQYEEKFGVTGKFVIVYLGAMGFANGLDYLLSCAKACSEKELPVHFLLAGDGVEKENLKRRSVELALNNLSFIEFQNRQGVYELMNVADAVFVCYRHAPILETGSPNKFFDGLAAGKLIIVNFGGWIKNEIETAQCGFYVDPEIPGNIVDPLATIIKENRLDIFQKRSWQLAEKKFSRKKLSEMWIKEVIGDS